MEKNVKISMLCSIYGKLLTEKQLAILEDYYDNDLSLSEIAENQNITRQAVRDIIKKGETKLFELEEKLEIMKRMFKQERECRKELYYCINEDLDARKLSEREYFKDTAVKNPTKETSEKKVEKKKNSWWPF